MTSVERPGGLVGMIAAWMDDCAVVPQPDLSLSAALVAVGAVLGRRWETDGGVRAVLHVVGVAAPGAGKESARQCVISLFQAAGLNGRIGSDGWASAQGLRAELMSCPTRLWLPDELGRALQAYGSHGAGSHERQIVDELLRAWGSAAGTMLGKAYAEKEARRIEAPHGCLYGTTTPGSLWKSLRGTDVVDGLFSRWIVTVVEGAIPAARDIHHSSRNVPADLAACCRALSRGGDQGGGDLQHLDTAEVRPKANVIPMERGAHEGLRHISENVRTGKLAGDERVAALWSRAREQTLRVALCLSAGREASTIGEDDVAWAWSFVRSRMRALEVKVLVEVADDEQQRCQGAIVTALGRGALTRRLLTRVVQRFPKRVREEALSTLIEAGVIRHDTASTATRRADVFALEGGSQ